MATVPERLIHLLEKQTGRSFRHIDSTTALEDLRIDSFDFLELLFTVEDEFGIAVDDRTHDVRSRLKTVGDVVALVEDLTSARAGNLRLPRMAHA